MCINNGVVRTMGCLKIPIKCWVLFADFLLKSTGREFALTARGQSYEQINIGTFKNKYNCVLLSFVTVFRDYAADDYIGLSK